MCLVGHSRGFPLAPASFGWLHILPVSMFIQRLCPVGHSRGFPLAPFMRFNRRTWHYHAIRLLNRSPAGCSLLCNGAHRAHASLRCLSGRLLTRRCAREGNRTMSTGQSSAATCGSVTDNPVRLPCDPSRAPPAGILAIGEFSIRVGNTFERLTSRIEVSPPLAHCGSRGAALPRRKDWTVQRRDGVEAV